MDWKDLGFGEQKFSTRIKTSPTAETLGGNRWVKSRPTMCLMMISVDRAEELKVDFLVQQGDSTGKTAAIEQLLAQEKLNWSEVCFVGDDIIDLGPLTRAGLAVAVGDAVPEARAAAHFTTRAAGGRGAVREALELILRAQGKWAQFPEKYSE